MVRVSHLCPLSPGDNVAAAMASVADSYVTADYTAAAELTSIDLYWTAARPRTRRVVNYKFTALDGSASRIGILAIENQHTVTDLSQRSAGAVILNKA